MKIYVQRYSLKYFGKTKNTGNNHSPNIYYMFILWGIMQGLEKELVHSNMIILLENIMRKARGRRVYIA
jgi:hypothetical protein